MQRRFVLQPLADVRGGLRLPGADAPVADLLVSLPAGEEVSVFAKTW
jgi:7,8-dihydro-6-hydroxymethylpterin-pyrophosphokinase